MKKTVFTNGCFDIIHAGHISLLERAKALGEKLIVGINSDRSVRSIKGSDRPVNAERDRATVLMGLASVDEVRIFDDLTPEKLIQEIKPDVLVKGGDWKENEIIGADFVKAKGGEVFSLELLAGYSSSNILDKVEHSSNSTKNENLSNLTVKSIKQHIQLFEQLLVDQTPSIDETAECLFDAFSSGNKVLICGNGGSAADAQHLAAEFVGRYEAERKALSAIALTTDTSAITAVSNDYTFDRIFSRQVEALAKKGDVLVAISTSGNSPNVIEAVMTARKLGCKVIGLTGSGGKKLASLSDLCVLVPEDRTARIQEAHITIMHIWCELIEAELAENSS